MNKRRIPLLAICLCLLLAGVPLAPVSAKDTWTSVRSQNFLLVGNVSEKDLRRVSARLEQFREVFSRLFTTMTVNSPIPTRVVVFKNEESYKPFNPGPNTAGYFQPGDDVNYITLIHDTNLTSEKDPFNIIFHEYTHLLIKNTKGSVPTWFNEGLAEYYSTFSISDDQKIVMGSPIAGHVFLLRAKKMLPLRTLFEVDQSSPHYNERDKKSIFYAESWALIHYLILGKDGQRMTQMSKFVNLLSTNVPLEQAFQQAFAMTIESLEKELYSYIQRDSYPILRGSFANKVEYDTAMQSAPLTEAEVQAYLGDLQLHSNRADCETYLQKALALDPALPLANAALGILRMREDKPEEARKNLERAAAANSPNYLIHYYYAYALSREANRDVQTVLGFAPETAARMRAELMRAIELRPDFSESYSLLAYVNLVTNTDVDETLELLQRVLRKSPGRNDLVFMMAQLYLHQEDFKSARQLMDKLASGDDEALRQRAKALLSQLDAMEEDLARNRVMIKEGDSESGPSAGRGPLATGDEVREFDSGAILRESLRKPAAGEKQAQGKLARIDCDAKNITFVVRINERLLKLSTDDFRHVDLMSFSADAGGQVTCGLRKPENNVVVAYLPASGPQPKVDGVIKSVEFVPQDFNLQPTP